MLEIRYRKDTGVITAWAGSPGFTGGHLKPKDGEEIIVRDIPNHDPNSSSGDYLIVDGQLVRVKQPEPTRNLFDEIDELKAELQLLKE